MTIQKALTSDDELRLGLVTRHDTPQSPHKEHMSGGRGEASAEDQGFSGVSGQWLTDEKEVEAVEGFLIQKFEEDAGLAVVHEALFEMGALTDLAKEAGVGQSELEMDAFQDRVANYVSQSFVDRSMQNMTEGGYDVTEDPQKIAVDLGTYDEDFEGQDSETLVRYVEAWQGQGGS